MTDWRQKIVAYLHDPPEKAYDYSPQHEEWAKTHLKNLDIGSEAWESKDPDHIAAAADRFIFPASRKRVGNTRNFTTTGVGSLGDGLTFKHPLSGDLVFQSIDFPDSEDQAHSIVSEALPDFKNGDEQLKFWLMWRLWLQFTVEHKAGKGLKAEKLAYIPADTRIPDGSIWHHMSIVSALESTRGNDKKLKPAFLMFQLGPVQDFIKQARSTRDSWSGSYMLSWMMAHVLKGLADEFGPDSVIFPSLKGQPIYDWLEQDKLKQAAHSTKDGKSSKNFWELFELDKENNRDLFLTPNLPNRLLAIVPSNCEQVLKHIIDDVFDFENENSVWSQISGKCFDYLNERAAITNPHKNAWEFQVRNFWQYTYQIYPWKDFKETLDDFAKIPVGKPQSQGGKAKRNSLQLGHEIAKAIDPQFRDNRCYSENESLNNGWAWSAHYQLLSHAHDARRQTREFSAWISENGRDHKDAFSGKEEAIATSKWLEQASKSAQVRHLFRHKDELGAVNLIKRVWHKAYLQEKGLSGKDFKFQSVPGIAAGPWMKAAKEKIISDSACREQLKKFKEAVENAQCLLDFDLPYNDNDLEWLTRVDASIFQSSYWENIQPEREVPDGEPLKTAVLESLNRLNKHLKLGKPSRYFAVLALDGDKIGKWLSGENTPPVRKVITEKAVAWFKENIKGADSSGEQMVETWLNSNRMLSPSYHLQFSEALSNFGLYCARRIVESHFGQLIYSGGDDVLAVLPATEAIACAQGLRYAFQGNSLELNSLYPEMFQKEAPSGFIQLVDGKSEGSRRKPEPSWPLLVPGPNATVSVGISVGHIKQPLQDMIEEAQAAEKRAKNRLERNAIAVTLFKRGGEILHWGSKFSVEVQNGESSAGLKLLSFIQEPGRFRKSIKVPEAEPDISGRFPYRISELLRPYLTQYEKDHSELRVWEPLNEEIVDIAGKETDWVISRQCSGMSSEDKSKFLELCKDYLNELNDQGRTLEDYMNLFNLEAFISRQGD